MTYNSTVASQHRHSSFRVRRPQRAPAWAGHRPVARPADFLGRHPAERVLLISGVGTTTLGLLLNYLAVGSSASTSAMLLSSGHFLLVVGTLLLLAWFIALLMRALQEK